VSAAVVGHEDHQRILFEAALGKKLHQPADVFVYVLDHRVELGHVRRDGRVARRDVARRRD